MCVWLFRLTEIRVVPVVRIEVVSLVGAQARPVRPSAVKVIPHLVLRVHGPGGHGDRARHIAGRRHRTVTGDLAEDTLDREEPPQAHALHPDLGPGRVRCPRPGGPSRPAAAPATPVRSAALTMPLRSPCFGSPRAAFSGAVGEVIDDQAEADAGYPDVLGQWGPLLARE